MLRASQDAEAARRICEALRSAGIEVWFDQKVDLAAYVGTFKDPWRGEATIARNGDGLTLSFSHTKELTGPLTPIRPGLFVVCWKNRALDADAYMRFREYFAGAVEGFTMEAVSANPAS